MASILHQRCFNHGQREAVARCPQCGHSYCRECITEHDDRMICMACLRRPTEPTPSGRRLWEVLAVASQALLGLVALWLIFYLAGSLMLSLPSSFHDGTIWQGNWLDEP